ncbi:MAG: D,D-heptose 1,7-bisphosphate phosphatase [Epsilonproteobacteria bacterium]|nr:MAG: D,D-heptose 1,7-bisphosphate phosphatase [Campylobacterota bacterium]
MKKLKKSLFLDRDGVVNIDTGYVSKTEDFKFTEGIFDLLHLFTKHNYQIFIVTNQSGIGRGYYTQDDFDLLTHWMLGEFQKQNINISSVHYCPHAPEDKCLCRKPQTGMIDEILTLHSIDLEHSWLIGDKQSDINLAINSHIGSSIAIGKRIIKNSTYCFDSILECKEYLEENQGKII